LGGSFRLNNYSTKRIFILYNFQLFWEQALVYIHAVLKFETKKEKWKMEQTKEKSIASVLASANLQLLDGLYIVGEFRGVDQTTSKAGKVYHKTKVLVGDNVMKLDTPPELLMVVVGFKTSQRVLVSYREFTGQYGTNHNLTSIESL
jgi:hypothetical protein